jgi:arylsulfate sulfotransferase
MGPIGLSGCSGVAASKAVQTEAIVPISPFISLLHFTDFDPYTLTGVQYTVAPKPGSVSKPVHVEYSASALAARGYIGPDSLTVPVFGLYSGYSNQVSVELATGVGSTIPFQFIISTPNYVDPSGVYSHPNIVTPRASGSTLGFDFMFIKSELGSPVIIDTDGEIRWAASGPSNSGSSTFTQDEFIIGDEGDPDVYALRLDLNISQGQLPSTIYTDFNHNINYGKNGFLAEVDAGPTAIESNVIEFTDSTSVSILSQWNLAAILSSYMSSRGDDAAAFVRPGIDWFHSNSAIYDSQDDSVIVSSRENFVIKLDYKTGAIIWIFGDPTKYWYTFPSLRAKALTLAPGGLYPIGQHALSILSDGSLMLFNDGLGSLNEPAGAPPGQTRTYSAVSDYSINETSMTAQNVWNYEAGQEIFSPVCSSAYETTDNSILVDYATADNYTEALLVGLGSNHDVVFEFQYPTIGCDTSWNARPIALDNLKIDQ